MLQIKFIRDLSDRLIIKHCIPDQHLGALAYRGGETAQNLGAMVIAPVMETPADEIGAGRPVLLLLRFQKVVWLKQHLVTELRGQLSLALFHNMWKVLDRERRILGLLGQSLGELAEPAPRINHLRARFVVRSPVKCIENIVIVEILVLNTVLFHGKLK